MSQSSSDSDEVKRIARQKKKKRKQKKKAKKGLSSDSDSEYVSRIEEKIGFTEYEIEGQPYHQHKIERVLQINPGGEPIAVVQINGRDVKFTVDSGVKRNLISWKDWKKIAKTTTPLHTGRRFVPYGTDMELPVRAKAMVTLEASQGAEVETEVFIVESNEVETLLGRDDALRLGILLLCPEGQKRAKEAQEKVAWLKLSKKVKMEEGELFSGGRSQSQVDRDIEKILSQYLSMFKGVGLVKDQVVDIQMKPNARPKIQPRRTIPFHYTEPLKKKVAELKR